MEPFITTLTWGCKLRVVEHSEREKERGGDTQLTQWLHFPVLSSSIIRSFLFCRGRGC